MGTSAWLYRMISPTEGMVLARIVLALETLFIIGPVIACLVPGTRHPTPDTCPSPMQFHHVFIGQKVIPVDHLALEFPVPPDARIL